MNPRYKLEFQGKYRRVGERSSVKHTAIKPSYVITFQASQQDALSLFLSLSLSLYIYIYTVLLTSFFVFSTYWQGSHEDCSAVWTILPFTPFDHVMIEMGFQNPPRAPW